MSDALAESHRALELDPLSPIMNLHLGWHYLHSQQYDLALDQLAKTLYLDANYGLTYWYLGLAYEQKGMYGEALRELGRAKDFLQSNLAVDADRGRVYAVSGRRSEADKAIAGLKKSRRDAMSIPTRSRSSVSVWDRMNGVRLARQGGS